MKKIKMFAVAAMFCAAAFAGYTAYDQATMTDAERMLMANLEALTYSGEFNGQNWDDDDDWWSFGEWFPNLVDCTLEESTGGSVGGYIAGTGGEYSWDGSTTTTTGQMIDCQNGDGNCWNGTDCIPQ